MAERYVVVGGGLAGAKAAETLSERTDRGNVVIVAEEPVRPYERPPLSKAVLRGDDPEDTAFVHDEAFYNERGIDLRVDTAASRLDVAGHRVELADGTSLSYDKALLATGSAVRRLQIPGGDLDGVHYLRTLADARGLREALQGATSVVVVGAGWIGCEVAASARTMGAAVTMLDPLDVPLQRVLGLELGGVFRELHADHGVHLQMATGVAALHGSGRVEAVETSDGGRIAADVVVIGVGVTPRVELAEAAGLRIDDGVVTDEYLRTSAPDVFAAGDVASALHPHYGRHLRVEHWAVALNQGPAAAANMLGDAVPYRRLPYFFSDQYDLGLEYLGHATDWDRIVVRGDLGKRELVAFYLADERVQAALAVNTWDVIEPIRALIESRAAVPEAALRDVATDLATLA